MNKELDLSRLAAARKGVTVLEVLFATGIVIFGLVGIASLIGVAGRQASDSNRSSESNAIGLAAYDDFEARGFSDSARWSWYNDQLTGTRYVSVDLVTNPVRATSVGGNRLTNRHAICIDPSFFASPLTATSISSSFASTQAYRPGLFPYYQDNFNPLVSPVGTAAMLSANRARLLRVNLNSPDYGVLSAKQIDRLFSSLDDLAMSEDENDDTLPAFRVYDGPGSAQAMSKAEYSWFATLSPREFLPREDPNLISREDTYTLSIVVCHRRDRAFFVPGTGEAPPQGERLAEVVSPFDPTAQPPNFTGGSGGRVQLAASTDFDDTILIGDWVMLCRHQASTVGLSTVCRWYRVIGVDADPVINLATDVWTRNVVLDGPDWFFDPSNPTQATLVSGVVNVLERVVDVD